MVAYAPSAKSASPQPRAVRVKLAVPPSVDSLPLVRVMTRWRGEATDVVRNVVVVVVVIFVDCSSDRPIFLSIVVVRTV